MTSQTNYVRITGDEAQAKSELLNAPPDNSIIHPEALWGGLCHFFPYREHWTGYRFGRGFDYFFQGHAKIEVAVLHLGGDIKEAVSARSGVQREGLG